MRSARAASPPPPCGPSVVVAPSPPSPRTLPGRPPPSPPLSSALALLLASQLPADQVHVRRAAAEGCVGYPARFAAIEEAEVRRWHPRGGGDDELPATLVVAALPLVPRASAPPGKVLEVRASAGRLWQRGLRQASHQRVAWPAPARLVEPAAAAAPDCASVRRACAEILQRCSSPAWLTRTARSGSSCGTRGEGASTLAHPDALAAFSWR